jgi:cell division protease FtsH
MDEDLAEFARTYREFMDRMTRLAYADARSEVRDRLDAHLGIDTTDIAIVAASFAPWDHVNIDVAMTAWLAEPGRTHEVFGLMGQQRHLGSMSDLIEMGRHAVVRAGSVDLIDLPVGPDETRTCVNFGIFLISDGDGRLVVMVRGPHEHHGEPAVAVEVLCAEQDRSRAFLADLRRLIVELNVFRGQVIAFGESHMGHPGLGPIVFLRRPELPRDRLVMGPGVLESVEREIFGIAKHRERLRAAGQHVKRGLLLHGPPGTGKTLTVRYLLSELRDHTVLLLTGGGLGMVRPACSLARLLQPAVVVLEDVDLVAEERGMSPWGSSPVLFDLLNEMDGMAEDADVAFLLTTNRADLLESALAARPGRVDLAVEIGLPDADARRRLMALYAEGLDLRLREPDRVIARTEGVTASFIKELMRKSALLAAEVTDGSGSGSGSEVGALTPIPPVTDEHVGAALDELLAEGNALTRALLGGAGSAEEGAAGRMSLGPRGVQRRRPWPGGSGVAFLETES